MARPFEGVFGNTCELRLIEFLLPLEGISFNVTELSEEAGVSRVTTGKVVKKFVEWGVLEVTEGGVPEYSINVRSPIVQSVDMMNQSLIERMLGEEKVREIREYIHHHTKKPAHEGIDSSEDDVWSALSIVPGLDVTDGPSSKECWSDANGDGGWGPGMPCATANGFEADFSCIYQ